MVPEDISGTIDAASARKIETLDEPVSETIMRDLRMVGSKLKVVLRPQSASSATLSQLKEWDLWGPLLVCLVLSILLSITAPAGQSALVFSAVFVVVSLGAVVITLNAQLLGSHISFFQCVCVLGYCVFPLTIAALLSDVFALATSSMVPKVLLVLAGFIWSTRASVVFMAEMVNADRRALAVYPVFLFYSFLSWMVLIQ